MSMRKKSYFSSAQIVLFPTGETLSVAEERESVSAGHIRRVQRPRNPADPPYTPLRIGIKKLHPDATLPFYAHGPREDAGMDLRSVERIVLAPGVAQGVPTGIAVELPPYWELQIRPRSGLALKHSVYAHFGTIDAGYRGEIRVIMFNSGSNDYVIEKGDRIAQFVIGETFPIEWVEHDELGESQRGGGGFGSSGR
jgi:dUTP diphosphatase